jgi:type III secretion protein L
MGLAYLIVGEKIQLLFDSGRKVFKGPEYASVIDSEDLLRIAKAEALTLTETAQKQAEQQRQKGFDEGWQAAQQAHADQVTSSALQAQKQVQAERSMMARVMLKALGSMVKTVPNEALLHKALQHIDTHLRHEAFITLHVNRYQVNEARLALEQMGAEQAWARTVAVQVDEHLRHGDCQVQTASGVFEIGLNAQLRTIARALHGDAPQTKP